MGSQLDLPSYSSFITSLGNVICLYYFKVNYDEGNSMSKGEINLDKKIKRPLFRTLLVWFLLLALLPMGISSWLYYYQAQKSLIASAQNTLIKESNVTNEYVSAWFHYRFMDLSHQAEALINIELISDLSEQFNNTQLPLKSYVESAAWIATVEEKQADLLQLSNNYDYIKDLFLIDTKGNVLFSVMKKEELGTNLLSGDFSTTKFAKAVTLALSRGEKQFSDIEYYNDPSELSPSGFMTTPLIDHQGHIVGVFAIQLNLKRIVKRILSRNDNNSSLKHYLIGEDRLLRSPIQNDLKTILKQKVESLVIDHWLSDESSVELNVYEYLGPEGETVFGVYHPVKTAAVKWALISEINKSEVFSPIIKIAISLFFVVTISILIVLAVAIFQVKRILAPVNQLIFTAEKVIQGETDQQVSVDGDNEFKHLADVFNVMLSKRLESDLALQESNQSLRDALLELSGQQYALHEHAIVSITDTDGFIEFVNDKFSEVSGYDHDELIGRTHNLMNSGVHDDFFFKKLYETIYGGKVWHGQVCNKNKNGNLYWLETTIAPFKDDEGNILRFIEIRTDITKQKEYAKKQQIALVISDIKLNMAKELVASTSLTQRLKLSLEHLFRLSGFKLLNKAGLFIFNEKSHSLELAVQLGSFDNQEVVIADLKEQCASQLDKPQFIQNTTTSLLIKHGEIVPHGHYIIPILASQSEDNKTGLVGVLYLLTEPDAQLSDSKQVLLEDLVDLFSAAIVREKARKLLKQATVSAQQSSVLKSEFLASMSHEIRTPMNGVLGMLGLLQNSDLNHEQLHKANLAKNSAESLLVLINDILDFSKVEAGKLELDIIDFNIHNLMGEFSESMAFRAQEKGLELILDMATIDHSMVKGDPGRIRQILTNIVGNSIKFTDEGEIKITTSLEIKTSDNLLLTCSIEDTGIGIPADKINTLCDSFSQVDASTTRKYGGTGLGLAISKKLCALMNGEITITSELGKGSCFTFTAEVKASDSIQSTLPKVDIRQLTLLIVDDNKTNREVLRGQLEHWGAKVVEAESAELALACCKERLREGLAIFNVAFLDMQMPEMDGAQLGEAIRAEPLFDDMRMVMMTSIANQNETQFFAKLGFDAYFPKPATAKDLFEALHVVADNGTALQKAFPLVTRDYLRTLVPETKSNAEMFSTISFEGKAALDKSKIKLLLVEDNVVNQQVALGLLSTFGFTADVAENGQVALDLLNATEVAFDLILIDCQMPVLDGYETTHAIRLGQGGNLHIDVPIIAMTANAMLGDREKCLNAGMNDYIAKPIDPNLFETTLYKWLATDAVVPSESFSIDVTAKATKDTKDIVWDQQDALHRVVNNEHLLVDLLTTFKQEIPSKLIELSSLLATEKQEDIRAIAHTIKGAASNISAFKLTSFSFELEQLAAQNKQQSYSELFKKIKHSYEELVVELSLYIDDFKEKGSEPEDNILLSEQDLEAHLLTLLKRLKESEFIDSEEISPLVSSCNNSEVVILLEQLHMQVGMFDLANAIVTIKAALSLLSDHTNSQLEV